MMLLLVMPMLRQVQHRCGERGAYHHVRGDVHGDVGHFVVAHHVVQFLYVNVWVVVRQQMRLEVGLLVERLVAFAAFVRRVLQMGDLVHLQRARLAETFAAVVTLERLLLGVNVPMVA